MDCEKLSVNAMKIFEKIKEHYPPDPWKKPRWTEEGLVHDNTWHDLRKKEDREKLTKWYEYIIGSTIVTMAYAKHLKNESYDGSVFRFKLHKKWIELAVLLHELDFQIETLDIIDP